jgi:glycosyltransferase involved in cell wall biosynthesis
MINNQNKKPIRVLYSYPHKIGADRICYLAWQIVSNLALTDADLLVFPGAIHKPLPSNVRVRPTLALGRLRLPYKIIGTLRAAAIHDYIVSRRIEALRDHIDIIHVWPLGALRTLRVAKKLGIPTVLERPNAHTAYAYEVVQKECDRVGINLPTDHEHAFKADVLQREEEEYGLADRILCPSNFVANTFLDKGFSKDRIAFYKYGFDEEKCYPSTRKMDKKSGLTTLFAGGCAPRKGLHFALEAWLNSKAHQDGQFLIVGDFVPGYAEKLSSALSHPSVQVLGYRNDLPDVMRKSDVLILPSVEEGSALVIWDAIGCGCVPVVSNSTGAHCTHMENALVHEAGDVETLTEHINLLNEDRELLEKLRSNSLGRAHEMTWSKSGTSLLNMYKEVINQQKD